MGSSIGNLGFGLNDVNFSNRVLCLEIEPALASDSPYTCVYGSTDLRLKKFYINSLTLALKSPFFYKLFTNGMRESQHNAEVALRINESEEEALMDLLKSMYGMPMNATSRDELMDVMIAADKFEVPSCMKHCVDLLLKLPMTTDSAVFYLGLPPSILVVQKLIESAKQYLSVTYRDFNKSKGVLMGLPLCAIEVVLGSDGLQVHSEDVVFEFILKWARLHYPEPRERSEILANRLVPYICFPNITSLKLNQVMTDSSDFGYEQFSKLVLKALLSKDDIATRNNHPRRVYNGPLTKVAQLEFTRPRCVVYLELWKQHLKVDKRVYSQDFWLGGQHLCLYAQCRQAFGLFLATTETSETCTLGFEIAVMKKSSKEFTRQFKVDSCNVARNGMGLPDLFQTPWEDFMSDESEYFIDGILHLRVDVTLIS